MRSLTSIALLMSLTFSTQLLARPFPIHELPSQLEYRSLNIEHSEDLSAQLSLYTVKALKDDGHYSVALGIEYRDSALPINGRNTAIAVILSQLTHIPNLNHVDIDFVAISDLPEVSNLSQLIDNELDKNAAYLHTPDIFLTTEYALADERLRHAIFGNESSDMTY